MEPSEDDRTDLEESFLLGGSRLLWAMSKAGAYPSAWPRFAAWMAEWIGGLTEDDLAELLIESLGIAGDGLLVFGEEETSDTGPAPKRLDLEWISIGKHLGLSFAELNELRIVDLAELHELYFGDGTQQKEATTDDIDRLFG